MNIMHIKFMHGNIDLYGAQFVPHEKDKKLYFLISVYGDKISSMAIKHHSIFWFKNPN